MHDTDQTIAELGNEPPLIGDGRSGPPDRREVSARWLSGTFLTGVTSSVLMGVALFAALDGASNWRPRRRSPNWSACRGQAIWAKRQDDKAGGAAPDRQGQGPPAHGSVDGHQGRRPRRHPHACLSCRSRWRLRPGTRPTRCYPAFDPLAGVWRGRRRRQPASSRRRPARSMAPRSRAR